MRAQSAMNPPAPPCHDRDRTHRAGRQGRTITCSRPIILRSSADHLEGASRVGSKAEVDGAAACPGEGMCGCLKGKRQVHLVSRQKWLWMAGNRALKLRFSVDLHKGRGVWGADCVLGACMHTRMQWPDLYACKNVPARDHAQPSFGV